MKITLCSSSSGGHVYPAVALGNYLESKGHLVKYIGIKNQIEEKIIKDKNMLLINHSNSFNKMIINLNIKKTITALKEINEYIKDSNVVILFGGFISFLVSLVCIMTNKRYYIHEQNVIIGDSNRFAYLKAKRVFRCFRKNKNKKEVITNNPSADLVMVNRVNIHKKTKVLFIFGSLGSSTLLKKTIDFINNTKIVNQSFTIINKLENYLKYTKSIQNKQNEIEFKEFIDLRKEIDNYDIIISRAGATTLNELMKSSAYVILVPSPNVKHNHQYKNASFLEKEGIVRIINEREYNENNISKIIEEYNNDPLVRYELFYKRKKIFSIKTCEYIEEILLNDNKD